MSVRRLSPSSHEHQMSCSLWPPCRFDANTTSTAVLFLAAGNTYGALSSDSLNSSETSLTEAGGSDKDWAAHVAS